MDHVEKLKSIVQNAPAEVLWKDYRTVRLEFRSIYGRGFWCWDHFHDLSPFTRQYLPDNKPIVIIQIIEPGDESLLDFFHI